MADTKPHIDPATPNGALPAKVTTGGSAASCGLRIAYLVSAPANQWLDQLLPG